MKKMNSISKESLLLIILLNTLLFSESRAQILIDQDFETGTTVDYILKDESNGGTTFPEDVSQAFADEDYCGRLQNSDLDPADGLDFSNIQGTRFFAVNDVDGVDAYPVTRDIISINWDNIVIEAGKRIVVSTFLAEGDAADNLEDWDYTGNFTRVRFEYSFDNTTWNTIFSIVGDPSNPNSTNTRPVLDSNNDGTPDSPVIEVNEVFNEFEDSFLSGTNTNVSLRIFMENLTGTDEDIAFDDFLVTQEDINVPVEFSSTTAKQINCESIELEWITQSENNNQGFEIQKSTDGISFQKIGFKDSKGNHNVNQSYNFIDKNIESSKSNFLYYRVKQIDFDGRFSYSAIMTIKQDCTRNVFAVKTFPTIVSNEINLLVNIESVKGYKIDIYDQLGKVVLSQQVDHIGNHFTIDVSQFNLGIHYIKVSNETTNEVSIKKIIIRD